MQPTIVKTSKAELCLVVVPDDAHDFRFTETKEMFTYEHNFNVDYFSSTIEHVDLPFSCELIGPLKDITEEQAKGYVKSFGKHGFTVYLDYRNSGRSAGPRDTPFFYTAIESLASLVSSTGLKGNVIILKRIA